MNKFLTTVEYVEKKLGLLLAVGGVAVAAIDPHQLPPKFGAAVVVAGSVLQLGQRGLNIAESATFGLQAKLPATEKTVVVKK